MRAAGDLGLADRGREKRAAASMTLAAASRVSGPRAAGHDDAPMTPGAPTSLELPLRPAPQAPSIARRRLAERFAAQLGDDELQDAMLLTSELVTNAVLHGRGQIKLTARLDEKRLTVNVADKGHGFEPPGLERPFDAVGGHGLNIVETIASRWGIHAGSSDVWFELDRRDHGSDPPTSRTVEASLPPPSLRSVRTRDRVSPEFASG